MQIQKLRAKIHHATITEANLEYKGSLTLDEDLMNAVKLFEHEKVHVVNVNNGERIETYLIKGARGSGVCCLNGAAARKGAKGDRVIIMAYGIVPIEKAEAGYPLIVEPLEGNKLPPDAKTKTN